MTEQEPDRRSTHIGAIDVVCNYEFTDERLPNPAWQQQFFEEKIGKRTLSAVRGFTPESFIAKMDADGIDRAMLLAVKAGSADHRIHYRVPYEIVAEVAAAHPDRFSALAGVDPTEGMRGLRERERREGHGVHRRAPLPPLVRRGSGSPEVLPDLREVRRTRDPDPDAGWPLPALQR